MQRIFILACAALAFSWLPCALAADELKSEGAKKAKFHGRGVDIARVDGEPVTQATPSNRNLRAKQDGKTNADSFNGKYLVKGATHRAPTTAKKSAAKKEVVSSRATKDRK